MSKNVVIVSALVAVVLAGGLPPARGQATVTRQEVLAGKLLGATDDPTTSIGASEVLALNDQMRAFLKKNVNPGGTDVFRLQQLTDAIMGKTHIRLEYDENTRTAAETFRLQRGNCLSFTTMFVALARGAGLKADFQEVDIPPDWTTRRDVFVLNRHVNIIVDVGAAGTRAVDFNVGDFKTTYDVDKISDKRAIAHFFNNMGVERMQEGDIVDAVAFYRRAIEESGSDFSPAWTNLGMLYRKHGHLEHAEVAYLQALKADKEDTVAMSNLVIALLFYLVARDIRSGSTNTGCTTRTSGSASPSKPSPTARSTPRSVTSSTPFERWMTKENTTIFSGCATS